ncbi:MAG: hypothetical protein AAF503_15805 [Pseudomonadota bacterium]
MTRWTLTDDGVAAVLAPLGVAPGWDLAAEATLPFGAPSARMRRRLAHQVRQDLWRALRRVRGFVPVVRVADAGGTAMLRAGGRVPGGRVAERDRHRVADVITNADNQRRWLAHAARAAV